MSSPLAVLTKFVLLVEKLDSIKLDCIAYKGRKLGDDFGEIYCCI